MFFSMISENNRLIHANLCGKGSKSLTFSALHGIISLTYFNERSKYHGIKANWKQAAIARSESEYRAWPYRRAGTALPHRSRSFVWLTWGHYHTDRWRFRRSWPRLRGHFSGVERWSTPHFAFYSGRRWLRGCSQIA